MCSCMCSCISMSALWTRCEGSRCVCILASVNLTCWFGRAVQELLIQQLHVVMWKANSALHDRQTQKNVHRCMAFAVSILSCLGWRRLLGTFCKITAQRFSFLHQVQTTVRVTKLCNNICLQYHRLFNNPNHINDYSWSWLRLKIYPYCNWMATDCKIKCEFSAAWNSVVSIL